MKRQMLKMAKHLNTAFICLVCFGQVIPCSLIMGCAKNYNSTKQEQTSEDKEDAKKAEEAKSVAATKILTAVRINLAHTDFIKKKNAAEARKEARNTKSVANTKKAEEEETKRIADANKKAEDAKKENAATKIQAVVRRNLAHKDFVKKKNAAEAKKEAEEVVREKERAIYSNIQKTLEARTAMNKAKRETRNVKIKEETTIRRVARQKYPIEEGQPATKSTNRVLTQLFQKETERKHVNWLRKKYLEAPSTEELKPKNGISASFLNPRRWLGSRMSNASKAKLKGREKENIIQNKDVTSTTEYSDWDCDISNTPHEAPVGSGEDQAIHSNTNIEPTAKLPSWAMRKVIKTLGLQASANTFESGGLTKPTFFYKADSDSEEKTYIAIACNRQPNDHSGQVGGEQSISIVLQAIKEHLGEHRNDVNILIPLQQIGKQHWTLLAITLTKNATSENSKFTAEAKHYDSKGFINAARNLMSGGKEYVDEQVKNHFSAEVNYQYEGTQGLFDSHNCGRYTLIKLLKLINSDQPRKELADIDEMINSD